MITNLSVKIGKFRLKNPVIAASGTFGYAKEFQDLVDLKRLGAIVTKTITLKARQGNTPPRIIEVPSGMLNAIGLENEGIANFIKDKLPFLKRIGIPIIVSITGDSFDEFVELTRRLDKVGGLNAIELNISCPNIKNSRQFTVDSSQKKNKNYGLWTMDYGLIAQDPQATYKLVKAVRKATSLTLITKLSPNVTDIVSIAKAAEAAQTDAISLVNTFLGMKIDIEKIKPALGNITGGLSGPAIRPIALRMVWEVARKVKIPVIGIGGIMNAEDALEFIIVGATAIEVGTANFINPKVSLEIIKGIEVYLRKKGIKDIDRLHKIL